MNFVLRALIGIAVGLAACILILSWDKTGQISVLDLFNDPNKFFTHFDNSPLSRMQIYLSTFFSALFGGLAFIALEKR